MTPNKAREMMTERQILAIIPVSRFGLWKWVNAGRFPKPIRLAQRRKAWYTDEVAAWQREREKNG